METIEKWKDIPGYDGNYQVSNLGRVRSKERLVVTTGKRGGVRSYNIPGIIHKDNCNGNGYRYITISFKSKRKNYYVHRLVAEAFLNRCPGQDEVNHINFDRTDNTYANLEWCNRLENIHHTMKNGYIQRGADKKNAIKVIDLRNNHVFDTIKAAADHYGIKYGLLKDVLRRRVNCEHKVENYKYLKYHNAG